MNELVGRLPHKELQYWRTKYGHAIDFILSRGECAIECKWTYRSFDPKNFKAFRKDYPHGKNYVVVSDLEGSFDKQYDDLIVTFLSLPELISDIDTR